MDQVISRLSYPYSKTKSSLSVGGLVITFYEWTTQRASLAINTTMERFIAWFHSMSMHLPESKELRRKINEDLNVCIRLRITKFNCQRKFTNGSPQLLFKSLQLVAVLYLHRFLLIIFTGKPRSIQSYCNKQTRNIRFTFPSFNFLSGKNILYAPAVTYLNSRRFM